MPWEDTRKKSQKEEIVRRAFYAGRRQTGAIRVRSLKTKKKKKGQRVKGKRADSIRVVLKKMPTCQPRRTLGSRKRLAGSYGRGLRREITKMQPRKKPWGKSAKCILEKGLGETKRQSPTDEGTGEGNKEK